MRINKENKSVDIESRDVNYILPAYIRSYLFFTKNEDPEKIVFPMFRSVPHPFKPGVMVPIEYVPEDSPVAIEIVEDGKGVPEAATVEAAEAEADTKEELMAEIAAKTAELESISKTTEQEDHGPGQDSAIAGIGSNQPSAARLAKVTKPANEIPPGSPLDGMQPRGRGDQAAIAKALASEPDIDETKEKPLDVEKDAKGKKTIKKSRV